MLCDSNNRYVAPEVVEQVGLEFTKRVPLLTGKNLSFAFIFGSFAKGYAKYSHDIDMFICLKNESSKNRKALNEFYFELHQKYGLAPDETDPGEIMTKSLLSEKLTMARDCILRPVIETYEEYEALCWAEILAGTAVGLCGDLTSYSECKMSVNSLPQRWRIEIFSMIDDPISVEAQRLSTLRLMKYARRNGYFRYAKRKESQ